MPPHQNKTNFKTYESSTRLLAAVFATAKPKLNYADLAAHVGGGATASAIDHRLRPVKQLAKMQAACKQLKKDPGDLPVDTQEIQKLYGDSTPAGIEWQFREIKALGRAQELAVSEGRNPAELRVGPGSSPRKARASGTGSTPGSKRKRANKKMSDDDVGDDSESNYDLKDVNSSEEAKSPTPKRRATTKAKTGGTIKVEAPKPNTPKSAPAKTNGTPKGTKRGDKTSRVLFPSNGSDGKSGSSSIFGNGASRASNPSNAFVIRDSDDENQDQGDKAERKNPQRSCRIKEEQAPDEDFLDSSAYHDYTTSTPGGHDDLSDGEI
ncbi:hypothetical protein F4805DRAFT_400756 [Annulohypoxylon moriforme]|nr:hypothetical protein F4805DRAFT_400756 [Annulohypoxylon moriforme]